jgi:hypothetical protein
MEAKCFKIVGGLKVQVEILKEMIESLRSDHRGPNTDDIIDQEYLKISLDKFPLTSTEDLESIDDSLQDPAKFAFLVRFLFYHFIITNNI